MSESAAFDATRDGFTAAANWFAATTREVVERGAYLDAVALGEWTVRDLVGHTGRALTTVEEYLRPDVHTPSTALTTHYYAAVAAGRADPDEVAERGRVAGRALGGDPVAIVSTIDAMVARVTALVDDAAADTQVLTPMGEWPLGTYLPTRVFELVVHTGDLRAAAGLPDNPAPDAAVRIATGVLAVLVARAPSNSASGLLRALTGRAALPPGFSLL